MTDKMREQCERLRELISQYWDIAWREGNDGRRHDTEEGSAQECINEIEGVLAQMQAAQRQGGEPPRGMFDLTPEQVNSIGIELQEAAEAMSGGETDCPLDIAFSAYIEGDEGREEGPFLFVAVSEYWEEGVYPIDQTGNAETRKTRVSQTAESDTQQGLSSVGDTQGGDAVKINDDMAFSFAYAIGDVPVGDTEIEEIKVGLKAALANVTAPQPAVPDGWMLVRKEWHPIMDEVERRAGKMCGLEQDFSVMVECDDYCALDEAERNNPRPEPPEDV